VSTCGLHHTQERPAPSRRQPSTWHRTEVWVSHDLHVQEQPQHHTLKYRVNEPSRSCSCACLHLSTSTSCPNKRCGMSPVATLRRQRRIFLHFLPHPPTHSSTSYPRHFDGGNCKRYLSHTFTSFNVYGIVVFPRQLHGGNCKPCQATISKPSSATTATLPIEL
jgi:hypothetical protein